MLGTVKWSKVRRLRKLQRRVGEDSLKELVDLRRQQRATAEILRAIRQTGSAVSTLLDTLVRTASELCDAEDVAIHRVEGSVVKFAAHFGSIQLPASKGYPLASRNPPAECIREQRRVEVADLWSETGRYPDGNSETGRATGSRTFLCVPLLAGSVAIGALVLRRTQVRPFTARHVELVETFASQAVIAIENARLRAELQTRQRELTESLEYQTAVSDVLDVIARSPGQLDAVLDAISQASGRLCKADRVTVWLRQAEQFEWAAGNYGKTDPSLVAYFKSRPVSKDGGSLVGRVAGSCATVHVPDVEADGHLVLQRDQPNRRPHTMLGVPLIQKSVVVGVLALTRTEIRPFTAEQIALVETFADQAVIAIENARLLDELQTRQRELEARATELKDSLEAQVATGRVLEIIAKANAAPQAVMDAIVLQAGQLCAPADAILLIRDGDHLRTMAVHGLERSGRVDEVPIDRRSVSGRSVIDRVPIHVHDVMAEQSDLGAANELGKILGHRTVLGVPLLSGDNALGTLLLRRTAVAPFTDRQIDLVRIFADQAVIAIENARLLDELQTRQKELETRSVELAESLEYKTAIGDVLSVISRSRSELQPVMQAIVSTTARLIGADRVNMRQKVGDNYVNVAFFGYTTEQQEFVKRYFGEGLPLSVRSVIESRKAAHVTDVASRRPDYDDQVPTRISLSVPLLREDELIGILTCTRSEDRPFTKAQISLVETFADQAVIAIENARLLDELQTRQRELQTALDRQTGTSEVLRIISSSRGDLKPVMASVLENATRLCNATFGNLFLFEDGTFRHVAMHGAPPAFAELRKREPVVRYGPGSAFNRIVETKAIVHVEDMAKGQSYLERVPSSVQMVELAGARSLVLVPLMKDDLLIGALGIYRQEVRAFSEQEIAVVANFADQAVIAIENARLLEELQTRQRELEARSAELTQSLRYQTAISDVLAVVSRSQTDLETVMHAIMSTASKLINADRAGLRRRVGDTYVVHGLVGYSDEQASLIRTRMEKILPAAMRAAIDAGTSRQINRAQESGSTVLGLGNTISLGVVLQRDGQTIGAMGFYRTSETPFNQGEIQLAETFADQAVIAIENARLLDELQTRQRELETRSVELAESLEYQTAISEVLSVIARSPNDLQPVLDVVARNAARVCLSNDARVLLIKGDRLLPAAGFGTLQPSSGFETIPELANFRHSGLPLSRGSVIGRSVVDGKTIHVYDLASEPDSEYPDGKIHQKAIGHRTALATPLLRDGKPLGGILIRRTEVKPFTGKQVRLLETFADQAVIAIENARLLDELQTRQRELTESLEYQTATSEVLGVISKSPTHAQPVFTAIAEAAARLCGSAFSNIQLYDGANLNLVATHNFTPEANEQFRKMYPMPPDPSRSSGRALLTQSVVHIPDVEADPGYPQKLSRAGTWRSILSVPMLRDGHALGTITVGRPIPTPFSERQIKLLATFADQAVIAMENARLFEAEQARTREVEAKSAELTESLEYQTAISDVLGVISRSPTDLQPVLDIIATNAARLCGAQWSRVTRFDGETITLGALHNVSDPANVERILKLYPRQITQSGVGDQAILNRRVVYHRDTQSDASYEFTTTARALGSRSLLAVPMLRDGEPVGAIAVAGAIPNAFTERQIKLLESFANQAVIAIENARLFDELQTWQKELEGKTAELTESLEYQTAISDVLGVISRSPTDLQPVLDIIATNAARLCGAQWSRVTRFDGETITLGALHNISDPADVEIIRKSYPRQITQSGVGDQALLNRRVVYRTDTQSDASYEFIATARALGSRSLLAVPMLRDGEPVGAIAVAGAIPNAFTERQIKLLESFANQAVIAINNVGLFEEVQARTQELTESLEYQTATNEVLGVIARSPGNLQPVLDSIVSTAQRLCESDRGSIWRVEQGGFQLAASSNQEPEFKDYLTKNPVPLSRASLTGRSVIEKRTLHVHDMWNDPDLPANVHAKTGNARTMLCVPLMRDDEPIGVVNLVRTTVRPYTQRQIDLVTTFAAQAVIAINNVGLFEEVQARTKDLQEALRQQTATADVLKGISRSAFNLQEVLDALVQSAAALCEAADTSIHRLHGTKLKGVAHWGPISVPPRIIEGYEAVPGTVAGKSVLDKTVVHVEDVQAELEKFPITGADARGGNGVRAMLAVPLIHDGAAIGVILLRRLVPGLFSERHVELVRTFADQAVIAIENARLFDELQTRQKELEVRTQELTESLHYQTATSEVLAIIAKSRGNLQSVMDAIVVTSARLIQAERAGMRKKVGNEYLVTSFFGYDAEDQTTIRESMRSTLPKAIELALEQGKAVQVDLGENQSSAANPIVSRRVGVRVSLGVPLLRDGEVIGGLGFYRLGPQLFTQKQIAVAETFADQAVIAIENARLLDELQTRQKELAQSVEELRSLGEVGRTVSSTLEISKVLQTVLENACKMTQSGGGTIYVYDTASREFRLEAGYNMSEEHIARIRAHPMRLGDPVVGECAERREAVQIEDLGAIDAAPSPMIGILLRAGVRAILAVPLLHQDEVIGALVVRRSYAGAFSTDTVRLLEAFAAQSAIAVHNARLFREVEEKGEQLRLASQHKSQFLANMSHELRTPLNAILGYTELMVDGAFGEMAGEQRETLDRIERNGRHLLSLINDVLDLSKIEAGEMALAIEEYALGSLVRTAIVATEPLARQKGLALDARIAEGLPVGHGDTRRLAQVLLNLIGNAIKFTERGGVTVSAACDGTHFSIAVRDTGPGIAASDLGRIFEKFQQVDNTSTRKKGGTGLGLAISREFIELHGGSIDASSVLGEGAVFTITLPVVAKPRVATLH